MEVFSPYIPINSRESNLPSTLFHVTLHNSSKKMLSAGVMGWLENAVCFNYGRQFPTLRKTVVEDKNSRRILTHSALEPPKVKKEPVPKKTRPVIVFEDFEKKDYGKWTMQGTAFGKHPAKGTLENQNPVSGFKGKDTIFADQLSRTGLGSYPFRLSRHWQGTPASRQQGSTTLLCGLRILTLRIRCRTASCLAKLQTDTKLTPWPDFGQNAKRLANISACKLMCYTTRPAGLEPATFGFEVRDSVQLSYGRKNP